MQGLFRNPLADPGIGAGRFFRGGASAAAATIVLGHRLLANTITKLPFAALPRGGAFVGGLATTIILYVIATRRGGARRSPPCCSAGVAIGALADRS